MEPFTYLQEHRLLVCTSCRFACALDETTTHLRTKHRQLDVAVRQGIVDAVRELPDCVRNQADLQLLPLPTRAIPALSCLQPPRTDGLQCLQCPYIACQVRSMQEHCRTKHGWHNPRSRGGNTKVKDVRVPDVPWRAGVSCQRFFRSRHGSAWFEVLAPPSKTVQSPAVSDDAGRRVLDTVEQQLATFEGRTEKLISDSASSIETNRWLDRVGWIAHLEGLDRDRLLESIGLEPELGWDTEQRSYVLIEIWASLERVVRAAARSTTTTTAGTSVLFEINKKHANTKPSKPFNIARTKPKTMDKYLTVWKRIVGYVVRTGEWDNDCRPPYKLSSSQEQLLDDLDDRICATPRPISNDNQEKVDRACIDFAISLLDHPIPDNSYESVLLSALAVLGIQDAERWVPAIHYTHNYAAVIKIARLLVVRQSQLECQEQEASGRGSPADGLFTVVRQKVHRFLTHTSDTILPTPVDWIFDAFSYGLAIRYTTPAQGIISWDGDEVRIGLATVKMSSLSYMAHQLSGDLCRTMAELLLLAPDTEDLPEIRWSALEDDASSEAVGYCFVTDKRNIDLLRGDRWIVQRILDDKALTRQWIRDSSSANPYDPTAVRSYGVLVDRFRELLLVAMHLIGGQPARATEILGLRYCNTPYGGQRNIFIDRGLACFFVSDHKNLWSSGRLKPIHRYLPREVGQSLVRYLWLVLPFWQLISALDLGYSQRSPFLWTSHVVRPSQDDPVLPGNRVPQEEVVWSSDRMRRVLERETVRLLGSKINISSWRHLAIAIGRRYLNNSFDNDGKDNEDSDSDDSDGDPRTTATHPTQVWDLQAGHSSSVAGLIYGREVEQGVVGTAARQDAFRKISLRWHRFLSFGASDRLAGMKRSYDIFDDAAEKKRNRRLQRLAQANLLGQLRQLAGSAEASFRGNQAEVLKAVVRGKTPIVQVASTGTGKSLTFMLPAYCSPDSVTVVIVPLVSLQGHLSKRCRTSKIGVEIWSARSPRTAEIVLVTPESAVTKGFQEFVSRLLARQELDRVVVDECHCVLDSTADFRPAVRRLGEVLALLGTQLIFLTATLPPRDEDELFSALHIHRTRVSLFRSRTTRTNIAYTVHTVRTTAEMDKAIVRQVEAALASDDNGKAIVYCTEIGRTEEISRLLGCPAYHSKIDTVEGKARLVEEWAGGGRLIVATNALGLGIDVPNVRLVVHAGTPRRLRDYVQESGRAGRDGLPAQAVIVRVGSETYDTPSPPATWVDPVVEDIAELVGRRDTCRRVTIDRVMDGWVDRVACGENEARCDVCKAREGSHYAIAADGDDSILAPYDTAEESSNNILLAEGDNPAAALYDTADDLAREVRRAKLESSRQASRVQDARADFIDALDWWASHCTICYFLGKDIADVRHAPRECPRMGNQEWKQLLGRERTMTERLWLGRKFAPYSGCFQCAVPQEVCSRWVAKPGDEGSYVRAAGRRCQYHGVIVRLVAASIEWSEMRSCQVLRQDESEELRTEQREEVQALYCKFGERIYWAGFETNNLCRFFYSCDRYVRQKSSI